MKTAAGSKGPHGFPPSAAEQGHVSLSRSNYRVPACEVHLETLEGDQRPICPCNAASQDGTRRGTRLRSRWGYPGTQAGGTADPCTVPQPSWGLLTSEASCTINRDKLKFLLESPLCRRVAHPWHATRVTEAMRLRCIEAVRGLRHHAAYPQAADTVIDAATLTGYIRIVPFQKHNLFWSIEKESTMKRSRAKGMSNFEAIPLTTQRNHDVRPRSAAGGYELSPVELDAIHGGTLKIEVPPYTPLPPKTEPTLPRIPYR